MKSAAKNIIHPPPVPDITSRVEAIDWMQTGHELDAQGCAMLKGLLLPEECRAFAAHFGEPPSS